MSEPSPLIIQNLYKKYRQHQVLKGVDLEVLNTSVHGLVGLNGAGKTTAMECMLGLQPFDSGDVSLLGKTPDRLFKTKGQVAVVFDEPYLHGSFTVEDVLKLAQLSVNQKDSSYLDQVLGLLSIDRYRKFKVKTLSLGNRRRAAIAHALVSRPRFIILDEPFNGLDAAGVDDVLALIRRLNQEEGITFLLASHQLPYLESVCTHMSILHLGHIVQSDRIDNLLVHEHEQVNITIDQSVKASEFLSGIKGVHVLNSEDQKTDSREGKISCELLQLSSAELNRVLVEEGFSVSELRLHKPSLEHLFRTITGGPK